MQDLIALLQRLLYESIKFNVICIITSLLSMNHIIYIYLSLSFFFCAISYNAIYVRCFMTDAIVIILIHHYNKQLLRPYLCS